MPPAPRSTGNPRRRLLALAIVLISSLSLAGALAYQAIDTARRHRLTAERTLGDYASFAAFILASRTYRQLGGDVVRTFSAWGLPNRPAPPPGGTECPAGTTWFQRTNPDQVEFRGVSLAADELAFLSDTLRNASALLEEVGWQFRFIRAPGGRFGGYFIGSFQPSPGKYGLRGFSVCLDGEGSPFRRVMQSEHVLPPAVTGGVTPDSLYSMVASSARTAAPVFGSAVQYQSPYEGSAPLGKEFGDLTVTVRLRPDLAGRLVIGGIPSSPTPLAIGLLALSTVLVVTALFQLRREYELIAIRSEFVSNVSHELRTPLSQILIFTELLRFGRLRSNTERQRSLDIIDQETRRLIRLVENVLQFSQSSNGKRRLSPVAIRLEPMIHETLEAFRPLAAARGATLETRIDPDVEVMADSSALRQILLNLLDNAVKYGPRDQTITIRGERAGHATRLMIDDQGPGIPLNERERVWEGYYRLARETGAAVAGSGIGLTVVRSLTTDLGGSAWIEDTETGGARFIVELPSGPGGPA